MEYTQLLKSHNYKVMVVFKDMEFKGDKNLIYKKNIFNVKNSFTYEFWVNPKVEHEIDKESQTGIYGLSGKRYVIGPFYKENKNAAGIGISVGTNGISVYDHSFNHFPSTLVYPVNINDWTHVAIVYLDNTPFLFINGNLIKKGLRSQKEYLYPSGIIGGLESYDYFIGELEDIRLWDHSRTKKQIKEYMFKKVAKKEGLIFHLDSRSPFNKDLFLSKHPEKTEMINLQHNKEKIFGKQLNLLFVTSDLHDDNPSLPYEPIEKNIISSLITQVTTLKVVSTKHVILEEAKKIDADCVLVFNGFKLSINQVEDIRNAGIKIAIWMTDDPYYLDFTRTIAPYYDYVFTQEVNCVSFYQNIGCKQTYFLPLAADPEVFYPKNTEDKYSSDILFIGSAFENRVKVFDHISKFLLNKNFLIIGTWWEKLKSYQSLKNKIINTWLSPEEISNYYNGAKIVINMHRDLEGVHLNQNHQQKVKAFSINPRTFEIAASGAFQLTDIREDLKKFYTPNYEIATYTSPNDLMFKIEYYLKHEEERKEMARRALLKTLEQNTYLDRVKHMLKIIFTSPS